MVITKKSWHMTRARLKIPFSRLHRIAGVDAGVRVKRLKAGELREDLLGPFCGFVLADPVFRDCGRDRGDFYAELRRERTISQVELFF